MNTKLTLNINKDIIEASKSYSEEAKISLSQLVERYLRSLVSKRRSFSKVKEKTIIDELEGVLEGMTDAEVKKAKGEYLERKYL